MAFPFGRTAAAVTLPDGEEMVRMGEMDEILGDFLVESYENLDRLDLEFVELEKNPQDPARLASIFRTIHTIKGTCGFLGFERLQALAHAGESLLAKLRDGALRLDAAITTALLELVDAVRAILARIEQSGKEGDGDYGALIATLMRLHEPTADVARAPAEPIAVAPARPASQVAESNLRVDVALVDKLLNLVGELVLARNQILQFATSKSDLAFVTTTQRLSLITTELQEGVMRTRMQPIGNLWSRLPRVVRDLAISCGKIARVEMEGQETELDRTILEAIKDPLTHLVRNSIDHGLERPETRVQRGKPAEGLLRLQAFHEGGQVILAISDDGGGIDAEHVKKKAVEKGVITPVQAAHMGDREALNLIFLPGFSLAEKVTNISGRGVGMDVVRANVEKIGGTVDIKSAIGVGTTIRIKIPLTLAIIPALIVTNGGDRFAIPQVSLLELVRLEGEQVHRAIESIQGTLVHRLRGRLLPLVHLGRLLGDAAPAATTPGADAANGCVNIVVLHADERQFGLVVEGIQDTKEIVVKPLSRLLKGIQAYAGATIMGDGRVALILDVMGVARMAGVVELLRDRALGEKATTEVAAVADSESLLLFSGGGRRMAIRLAQVARLEEFERTSVELTADLPVVQYRGEILPLVHVTGDSRWLAVPAGGANAGAADKVPVVVIAQDGRRIGLVVDSITDIVEEAIRVERSSHDGLRSAVLQQKVTELLDVRACVERADPSFFARPPPAAPPTAPVATTALATQGA